ncbi:SMI1/KNR4 family protein [Empedobacter sedimenti]|uniref:hypothetical protein n=1 Tax=Empedobacter sedimenti TaxID=3042610 RepID=UPI0024A67B07|nr:hypothetical protein [Empedobacter sedimenti]
MKAKNISFDKGLTDDEIQQIEVLFQIKFPADLKNFLQTALPTSAGFPHWRAAIHSENENKIIANILRWPLQSILHSVKNSDYWNKHWEDQPTEYQDKAQQISSLINSAPTLIPVYLHRYIPAIPNQKNLPVFSVYGIDIIPYGNNFTHYLAREFNLELPQQFYDYLNEVDEIPFWSNFDY